MISRNILKADRYLLLDKVRGALCGLAIGDSMGDAARCKKKKKNYGFTTDFNQGASWSTDDTEFALMVVETILQCKGDFTERDVEQMWFKHVIAEDKLDRGGLSEMEACENLKRGLHAPDSGKFNPYNHSDGAAMRSGPIGIFCAGQVGRAKRLAEIDGSISHEREGIWGAQAVACAVAMAMVDAPMEQIFQEVLHIAPENSWFTYKLCRAYEIVEKADSDIADSWMKLHNELNCTDRAAAPEAVPAVFACLKLEHSSFRKGLLLAANYGRDADTIGAATGAILGAKFGASAIPSNWLQKTRYPSGTCLKFAKGIDLFKKADEITDLIISDTYSEENKYAE